jgi:hypothetical protein
MVDAVFVGSGINSLAGGALLALVVASGGLLVLTARAERERIGT